MQHLLRRLALTALAALLPICTNADTHAAADGEASSLSEQEYPLLPVGPRGGSVWSNFCAGQADEAVLPQDPREWLVPGVNEGKAVAFNAYWKDCDNMVARPTTCGELRAQVELGKYVAMGNGEPGTPVSFAGGQETPSGLPAEAYNKLWEIWGLEARPDNFDQLVSERHGSPRSLERNPYPLPDEDPNQTDGGSGQLPMAYTQIRRPDGTWTGQIGTKVCVFCHMGQLDGATDAPGLGPQVGGAGSIGDFTVAGSDFNRTQGPLAVPGPTSAITIATNRGTGAIDFFQLAYILFSGGDPEVMMNEKIVYSGAIGNIKSPPWWNLAYRPQKFHGAVLPTDSSRIDLAAYWDLGKSMSGRESEVLEWVDAHASPFQMWAESTAPPPYPYVVDRDLAETGAIIFHQLDLWSRPDNPAPRPDAGNGSCASCHGVYSPRFAHDEKFLDRPELAGIAAYSIPMDVIGTDPNYAESMQDIRNEDGSIPPAVEKLSVAYCGVGNAGYTENNTPIMLTPPLWGVWASAPYFHNGSVPNIRGVLDPGSERPAIWKRWSTPTRADQEGKVVMGYDTNLARAYDPQLLGWRYDELQCGYPGTQPLVACDPLNPGEQSTVQRLLSTVFAEYGLVWNTPRPEQLTMTNADVENRKVYNTSLYSQGNQGHAFTQVLTDAERLALVEFLKTL